MSEVGKIYMASNLYELVTYPVYDSENWEQFKLPGVGWTPRGTKVTINQYKMIIWSSKMGYESNCNSHWPHIVRYQRFLLSFAIILICILWVYISPIKDHSEQYRKVYTITKGWIAKRKHIHGIGLSVKVRCSLCNRSLMTGYTTAGAHWQRWFAF